MSRDINSLETDFIVQIISIINAWANRHNYDNDDTIKKIGNWLQAVSEIATHENFKPSVGNVIRSMSDEELAQFLLDIAYENSPMESHELLRIPSPLGGYLVDGIIDVHGTDVVIDALNEEVDYGWTGTEVNHE